MQLCFTKLRLQLLYLAGNTAASSFILEAFLTGFIFPLYLLPNYEFYENQSPILLLIDDNYNRLLILGYDGLFVNCFS